MCGVGSGLEKPVRLCFFGPFHCGMMVTPQRVLSLWTIVSCGKRVGIAKGLLSILHFTWQQAHHREELVDWCKLSQKGWHHEGIIFHFAWRQWDLNPRLNETGARPRLSTRPKTSALDHSAISPPLTDVAAGSK
jgi:hypothetical protein